MANEYDEMSEYQSFLVSKHERLFNTPRPSLMKSFEKRPDPLPPKNNGSSKARRMRFTR